MPTSPPPQWLPAGTCIGHYRVEQLISSGGFGVVYRVSRDGQQFALKLPLPQPPAPADAPLRGEPGGGGETAQRGAGNEDEDHRALEQRIVREVVSLMTLNHPNIVRVHGFDRWPSPTSGALYLVMDFVEGVPLLQWRKNERPTVREVVRIFQTLALALDQAHRLGVVHRDIKSSNVLVAPDKAGAAGWKPVLVDFGLARPAFTTDVTREFVLLGTEGLWAPEHAAFGEAAFTKGARFKFTPATDLHALGLLFYQALTRFFGVFAPNSKWRRRVVPRRCLAVVPPPAPGKLPPTDSQRKRERSPPPPRLDWAGLLRRVFEADVLSCPCGGRRTVLALITNHDVARKMLGLPPHTHRPHPLPTGPPQLTLL